MSSRLRQPPLIITVQFCVSCLSASYFAVGWLGGYLVLQGNAALAELTHIFGTNRQLLFLFLMRGQFVHAFAKLFNTFTDGRTHLRQLFGAKDKQSDDKNDDQIESVKSGDHGECPFFLSRPVQFVHFLTIRYYLASCLSEAHSLQFA